MNTQNFDTKEGIAVIGMSGRFPGANNLTEFWDNLVAERDTVRTFSDDELKASGVSEDLILNPYYIKRRGILTDIDYFDTDLFKMTPTQAEMTDPQHRLFIEICLEALTNAGYGQRKEALKAGVFAGMSDSTYLPNMLLQNKLFLQNLDAYQAQIANSGHFLATKVAYHLNLKGPAINIQTACSTSLVTVIKACQSLEVYECDIALAGGVSISVPQIKGYLYQEGGVFSQDGICRAFDANANGTVNSNGLGVVVLKRLSDAIRDNDPINAIIISHALNNDGAIKNGYTAPSVPAQSHCIATALKTVDPDSISYVEAHGTATLLGDPIEIAALTQAFHQFTNKKRYCAIGSVKTNIGHTDTASGIAGLIKTILALKHKILPASLYFSKANPYIDFDNSPFYVQQQTSEWQTNLPIRRAGVSSFGIGGTNAHVVLQEAIAHNQKEKTIFFSTSQANKKSYWIEPDLAEGAVKKQDHEIYTYEPYWEVASLNNSKTTLENNKTWLVFSQKNLTVAEEFIRQLSEAKHHVFCIYPGEEFKKISEWSFQLKPSSSSDYNSLWQYFSEKNKSIDCVAYFWSLTDNHKKINILNKNFLENKFLSLLYLSQTLGKQDKPTFLLAITNYTQKILPDDKIIPDQNCLIAPLLTAPQEYEHFNCKLIDIAASGNIESAETAAKLIYEAPMPSNEAIVAYRKGLRLVKQYKNFSINNDFSPTTLKRNGVYLIIGAFGNIGIHLAAHLASHYGAHLILISRNNLSGFLNKTSLEKESRGKIWQTITENSASVRIITTDVSNDAATANTVEDLKNSYKQLDGIFHLAAATSSSHIKTLISDIDAAQITEQLLPKINGTTLSYKLSQEIPTGFCCLFSSLSSIAGGVGLTSYIAGNLYLDNAAATYRNTTKPLWISINWDAIETKKKRNPHELTVAQTMRTVDKLLNQNLHNTSIVVSAGPLNDKMDYVFKRKHRYQTSSSIQLSRNQNNESSPAQGIIEIFQTCLGLKNIDKNKSFYDLGGDSLDAIRLLDLLKRKFHVRLSFNDLNKFNSINKLHDLLLNNSSSNTTPLVKLNRFYEQKPTLLLIHPIGGTTFCYSNLAQLLAGKINCYGLEDPSLNTSNIAFKNIEEMASKYLSYFSEEQANLNFFIGGYSFGGNVAFEMTRQLNEQGKKTNPVIIIDGWAAFSDELASYHKFKEVMKNLMINEERKNPTDESTEKQYFIDLAWDRAQLLLQYNPSKVDIPIILFKANELLPEYAEVDDLTNYWQFYTSNILNTHLVEANHNNILYSNATKDIAEKISNFIL